MGRYCFFNTGMEYKFGFAVQSSSDILLFGGKPFASGDDYGHIWTAADKEEIEKTLAGIAKVFGIEEVCLSGFSADVKGTWALLSAIHAEHPTYLLGAIILHQLQYQTPLVARYEI
jgi:hypothetical protein